MRQFGRSISLTVGDRRWVYPDLHFDFRVDLDDDPEPNQGTVTAYNLSDDSINVIREGAPAVLAAGYGDDRGTVIAGHIDRAETRHEAPDRVTHLDITDAGGAWRQVRIDRSYRPGVRASQVLRDIFATAGLEVGAMSLPRDPDYPRGLTVSEPLASIAKRTAADAGARLHIQHGTVYIRHGQEGSRTAFVLRHDTGLVDSPQRLEEEGANTFNAWCLLNHRLKPDVIVRIESRTANGLFRVRRAQFIASSEDFMNHLEVVAI